MTGGDPQARNMKFLFLFLFSFLLPLTGITQKGQDLPKNEIYRESYPTDNDLVHTKLNVQFDYNKSWLHGNALLTLKPHFYSTDSVVLDAKQMEIVRVSLLKGNSHLPLRYEYDGWYLNIKLDKVYKASEEYTIHIEYTAKPDEAKIPVDGYKGLYFINPTGKEKNKPVQIWTDGQPEHTSFWCPTIDKPNQRSTEEIIVTVPDKYVTLSNGRLINKKKNRDGTRTDHWQMDQPHAPYLVNVDGGNRSLHSNLFNYFLE